MFGSRLVTIANVFDIRLRTMTEGTWNILKLDWKTPGIFYFQKSGSPVFQSRDWSWDWEL